MERLAINHSLKERMFGKGQQDWRGFVVRKVKR